MIQNGKQELNEDTMEKLLDNINFEDENNNNKIENKEEENDNINNENVNQNQKISSFQNIINESKTAEIISISLLNKAKKEENGKCEITDELKTKIDKALDNPIMKNDLLLSYKYISNLEQKEIEKPIKIISDNVEFESNLQTINKSVDVLKDLIENNNKIELKENTFKNLTDFIDNNDYNSYSHVDEIIHQNEENNKTFLG